MSALHKTRMPAAGLGRLLGQERGFTLVEVLVAGIIVVLGLSATLKSFVGSQRMSLFAQRQAVAATVAQNEIERLRTLSYNQMLLNGFAKDTGDPNHRIFDTNITNPIGGGGDQFQVGSGPKESLLVVQPAIGKVSPGGDAFTVGSGPTAVTGMIYRYVTQREEPCPSGGAAGLVCGDEYNNPACSTMPTTGCFISRRITVAVVLNRAARAGIQPVWPVWTSTIITDPKNGFTGATPTPAPARSSWAQSFFLYDMPCSSNDTGSYTVPTAHRTHNTASTLAAVGPSPPADYSTCESATKQPDLMGTTIEAGRCSSPSDTPGTCFATPFNYSNDLTGAYEAGLLMKRMPAGAGCPTSSYPADDDANRATNPNVKSRWSVHAWATKKFVTRPFQLSGKVWVNLWTTVLGGDSYHGHICATLIDRVTPTSGPSSGVPTDTVLGSGDYDNSTWPVAQQGSDNCGTAANLPCGRPISFRFDLGTKTIDAGHRLVLVLSVLSDSDNGLVFVYDDPRYPSSLQVETTTPCVPC